jgi:hypothetical protein
MTGEVSKAGGVLVLSAEVRTDHPLRRQNARKRETEGV